MAGEPFIKKSDFLACSKCGGVWLKLQGCYNLAERLVSTYMNDAECVDCGEPVTIGGE